MNVLDNFTKLVWTFLTFIRSDNITILSIGFGDGLIGRFTLDQLRILVTIADTGSFSAASRQLHRAQSSISQAIATLEGIQGVQLFDRSGHRPMLTTIGRILVEQARSTLDSAARFEAIAASAKSGVEAELAIAIDPLVPSDACIDSLQALNLEFPQLSLSFFTEGLGGAERRLRQGVADIALCTLLPTVPDDLTAFPLTNIKLIPVVAAAHPLAQHARGLSVSDINQHIQLVLSGPNNGPNYGVISTRKWRFVELSRRLDFLLSGLGWCRMPEKMVRTLIEAGQLLQLTIEDDPEEHKPDLIIYAAHQREQVLGPAAAWLLNDLRQRLSK